MNVFEQIENKIRAKVLNMISFDSIRPWGGFIVVNEEQAQEFAYVYFEGSNLDRLSVAGKLSPKILLVKPGARLFLQCRH